MCDVLNAQDLAANVRVRYTVQEDIPHIFTALAPCNEFARFGFSLNSSGERAKGFVSLLVELEELCAEYAYGDGYYSR